MEVSKTSKKWYNLSKEARIKIIKKCKEKGLSWAKIAVKVGLTKKNKSTIYQFADKIPELNHLFPKKQITTQSPIISSNNPTSQPNGFIPPPPPKNTIPPPPPPPKNTITIETTKTDEITEEDFLLKKIEYNTKKSKRMYGSLFKQEETVPPASVKELRDLQNELKTKIIS